jgi:uncharacterized protein
MNRQKALPAIAGLSVAWGGTALLVSPFARSLGNPASVVSGLLGQAALWLLCAVVICVVVFWEGEPLASLWLRTLRWQTLAWAAVLIFGSIVLIFPFTEWVRKAAGLRGYAGGVETVLAYPVWFRIMAVITAGVVEEVLFRGYAVTRLARLTGSLSPAVVLSSLVFAALHLPAWGAGPSLAFFIGGLATTAFFVWRRDLAAMIIAHAAIDAWALVVTPTFSRWWD